LKRRRILPILERVEVIDLAAEGVALAKVKTDTGGERELVVFVEKCVPGDIVDVQVIKKQKNFMQAYPLRFHKYSDMRVEPKCKHFGICGGCKWQSLPYHKQLEYKQKQVAEQLKHIGKIELPENATIKGSAETYFYRNKLEYTFSNKRWLEKRDIEHTSTNLNGLGFHIPGKFDKILDIEECFLQGGHSNPIRLAAKAIALELGLSFFDLKEQHGFLRNLIIRNSVSTSDLMVVVSFFYDDIPLREGYLDRLAESFPQITSLMYVINPKKNDIIADLEVKLFKGKDFIVEEMEGLKFKIGPKSFYQTNSIQAYELYCIVREYAGLKGDEIVYDLYTGTGTIANFIAPNAKKVIGIEYIEEAIKDARENSENNNLGNTTFFAGDMKDILNDEFIVSNGKPDVIILDPPRAGVHPNVVTAMLRASPSKIVYVSCNAATQARDIGLLAENYEVKKVQPVDMFPQTAHVENVVLLENRFNK
jgi:23S rRNA (uracil1939-C5)-methyltransferase